MVQGALYREGGAIESRFSGRCACSQEFIYPYLSQKCNVIIPAQGERLFAMTADDELVFSIPKSQVEAVLEGVEVTHKRGVSRIPTPFFGLRMKPESERYGKLAQLCGLGTEGGKVGKTDGHAIFICLMALQSLQRKVILKSTVNCSEIQAAFLSCRGG